LEDCWAVPLVEPIKVARMMINLNLASLYVGLVFGGCFLMFVLVKYRKAPEFLDMAIIILSCTGVVIGIHLGYVASTIPDSELGKLADHRVPIVLGALAVIWTSVGSIVKTCKQSIESIKS